MCFTFAVIEGRVRRGRERGGSGVGSGAGLVVLIDDPTALCILFGATRSNSISPLTAAAPNIQPPFIPSPSRRTTTLPSSLPPRNPPPPPQKEPTPLTLTPTPPHPKKLPIPNLESGPHALHQRLARLAQTPQLPLREIHVLRFVRAAHVRHVDCDDDVGFLRCQPDEQHRQQREVRGGGGWGCSSRGGGGARGAGGAGRAGVRAGEEVEGRGLGSRGAGWLVDWVVG